MHTNSPELNTKAGSPDPLAQIWLLLCQVNTSDFPNFQTNEGQDYD